MGSIATIVAFGCHRSTYFHQFRSVAIEIVVVAISKQCRNQYFHVVITTKGSPYFFDMVASGPCRNEYILLLLVVPCGEKEFDVIATKFVLRCKYGEGIAILF